MKYSMKLNDYLDELDAYISFSSERSEQISAVSIGWHLDHSLNVISSILQVLRESDPRKYKPAFNLWWQVLSRLKWLPRGKGKAPKIVQPKGEITIQTLSRKLDLCRSLLSDMRNIDASKYFKHPMFGHLKRNEAMRFLEIHTKHHLKICKDIKQQSMG